LIREGYDKFFKREFIQYFMSLENKVLKRKKDLADATSAISFIFPIATFIETRLAEISDEKSLVSRVFSAGVAYSITPKVMELRKRTKQYLGIREDSHEITKLFHDAIYAGLWGFTVRPLIYLVSGETDAKKIAIGTAAVTLSGLILGGPTLYVMDVFRDFVGFEKTDRRIPNYFQRRSVRIKKCIAMGFVATGICLTGIMYKISPDNFDFAEYAVEYSERIKDYIK